MAKTTSYEILESTGKIQLMKKFYLCLQNFMGKCFIIFQAIILIFDLRKYKMDFNWTESILISYRISS